MEAMRQSWSDDRLDNFEARVDERFDAVDRRFDAVDRRFDEVDRRLDLVDHRMARLEAGFDRFQHTIMLTGGGIIATLVAAIVAAFAA